MEKEKKNKNFKSGMVSIVGRPNVGKSTLLNRLLEEKVAIVSKVPQTTRNQVRGVYTEERGQIVFIDTPGLHMTKDKLDKYMNKSAHAMTNDVDCIIHLVDVKDPIGREEESIIKKLSALKVPIVLGLNKVDMKAKFVSDYIDLWEKVSGQPVSERKNFSIIPISGKEGINIDKLFDVLFEFLPKGDLFYPHDTVADVPQRMAIADVIREKFLNLMRNEIPHSIAVIVEGIEPRRKKTLFIRVLVLVETDSQKGIVVGKNGSVLKKVGTLARKELEPLLESSVFLDLYVKTKKKWRDNNSLLEEMGYSFL